MNNRLPGSQTSQRVPKLGGSFSASGGIHWTKMLPSTPKFTPRDGSVMHVDEYLISYAMRMYARMHVRRVPDWRVLSPLVTYSST